MRVIDGRTGLDAMHPYGLDTHEYQVGAHHYSAYGLSLRSQIRLPALATTGSSPADLEVRRGVVRMPDGCEDSRSWITPEEIYFRVENAGRIGVSKGSQIVIDAPHFDDRVAGLFVIGPAMGALLHQRGLLVLHASAVVLNGRVIAFLGHSGSGKSTMAAAMVKFGAVSFCDDLVPVSLLDDAPTVSCGYPFLKLTQESGEILGFGNRDWTPLIPGDARCLVKVAASSSTALPLDRVYVLGAGDRPEIELLEPQRAALQLIRYSYARPWIRNSGMSARHLHSCAALVPCASIRNLIRPFRLDLIHEVAELVLADCEAGGFSK